MTTQIHLLQGNCIELIPKLLRAASIDTVCTDLPFPRRFHPMWSDVSRVCARVMKPGAPFLTYSGQCNLPELLNRLGEHLEYYWLGSVVHKSTSYRGEIGVYNAGKPFLLFSRPPGFRPVLPNLDVISGSGREKQFHPWQQPLDESRRFIRWLTKPGDWVLDPCCGSATTRLAAHLERRNAIGMELDGGTYGKAKKRLEDAGIVVLSGRGR